MMLNDYQINKVVALGVPVLILLFSLVFFSPNDPQLWWMLIVITHTLAYMHFLLGYYYQSKVVYRSHNRRLWVGFFLCTLIPVLITTLFIAAQAGAFLAIIAIWYFVLHGTLNEHTLLKQQFTHAPEAKYFLPLFLYVSPFFLLSLPHPSFFFTPRLEFLNPPPQIALDWLGNIVSVDFLWLISLGFFATFIVLVPLRLIYNRQYYAGFTILLLIVATLVTFFDTRPLNYIILYFLALSYHFLSFSFHFLQKYIKERPAAVYPYLMSHAVVLLPFIALTLLIPLHIPIVQATHWFLFDGTIFLYLAMIHNTTSFLNEPWVKKYFL
jgi:hypothetical protein